jgi:hypothetical protein
MVKGSGGESQDAIEASGDTIVIADAIYAGLAEIAGAIREVAKALAGDEVGEPDESEVYLDGTRKG